MAYEVTATRRRPQKFEDLVGQEFVASTLKNSIDSGKIAHAYLFSGPRGCGKTSSARILAKSLNCEKGPTSSPCGVCPHCLEITRSASLDVIEIDGASNTSVNDVRQIKDEVLFPPSSSHYKIYIIDEVHMLSNSAFNALLKTIEEPPEYVIFIFATTELHKVPATIKSRCQQFNFRLVPIEQVKNLLADAAKEIGVEAEDEALYWIARESTGSIRDAYTLFDQVVAFSAGHISYEKIRDKLGLVGIENLNSLFESCAQEQSAQAIEKLHSLIESGISIEQIISNSCDYFRNLLLIKSGIKKESLLGQSPERFSQIVLQAWTSIQVERGLSIFLQLFRNIRYTVSPRSELELSISRLCWLKEYASSAEVKYAIEQARSLLMNSSPAPVQNQAAQQMQQVQNPLQASLNQMIQIQKKTLQPEITAVQHSAPFETPNRVANTREVEQKVLNLNSIEPAQLKKDLVQELKVVNSMCAIALDETINWFIKDDSIHCTAKNSFVLSQINNAKAEISKILFKMFAKNINFLPELEIKEKTENKVPLPPGVNFLMETFKGKVLGSTEITQEEQKSQEKPKTDSANQQDESEDENPQSQNSSEYVDPEQEDDD